MKTIFLICFLILFFLSFSNQSALTFICGQQLGYISCTQINNLSRMFLLRLSFFAKLAYRACSTTKSHHLAMAALAKFPCRVGCVELIVRIELCTGMIEMDILSSCGRVRNSWVGAIRRSLIILLPKLLGVGLGTQRPLHGSALGSMFWLLIHNDELASIQHIILE